MPWDVNSSSNRGNNNSTTSGNNGGGSSSRGNAWTDGVQWYPVRQTLDHWAASRSSKVSGKGGGKGKSKGKGNGQSSFRFRQLASTSNIRTAPTSRPVLGGN